MASHHPSQVREEVFVDLCMRPSVARTRSSIYRPRARGYLALSLSSPATANTKHEQFIVYLQPRYMHTSTRRNISSGTAGAHETRALPHRPRFKKKLCPTAAPSFFSTLCTYVPYFEYLFLLAAADFPKRYSAADFPRPLSTRHEPPLEVFEPDPIPPHQTLRYTRVLLCAFAAVI